jgi:transketolase
MSDATPRTMRDAVIMHLVEQMTADDRIFFLSADLGAPALDELRRRFPERFINVGIAEQNLITVATGIALEGGVPFAYGLAPFVSMRAFEQIRNNLALFGQLRPLNVNILALGAGLSYDVSGPTHHCVEDISIIRTLPGIDLLSPSDSVLAAALTEQMVSRERPAYLRLEGKPVRSLYRDDALPDLSRGFHSLATGADICFVGTGYPLHGCIEMVNRAKQSGISAGLVDVFSLRPIDKDALFSVLTAYDGLVSIEESFIGRGGLDTLLMSIFAERGRVPRMVSLGLKDGYLFENGDRALLHQAAGMNEQAIASAARRLGYAIEN